MLDKHDLDTAGQNDIHPMAKILFGWTTRPKIGALLLLVLSVLCAALIFADLTIDRHPHHQAEALAGFYGLVGFAGFAFAVLMGWPLGRLLRRSEDYYGDAEAPTSDEAADEEVT